MSMTYDTKAFSEEERLEMTPEKCWEKIERLHSVLTVPGFIQNEMREDPVVGPHFNAKKKELMHLIVDNYDLGMSPDDDGALTRISDLCRELNEIQARYVMNEISQGSVVMQMMPITELVESFETDDAALKKAMSEEDFKKYESTAKSIELDGAQAAQVRLHPLIGGIFKVGVEAAGGHAEFAKMQFQAAKGIPEEFRVNPSVMLSIQLAGALMKAITDRAGNRDYMDAQVSSVIEAINAAQQAVSMNYVAAWEATPMALVNVVAGAMIGAIEERIQNGLTSTTEFSSEQKVDTAKSTVFAGNSTVN